LHELVEPPRLARSDIATIDAIVQSQRVAPQLALQGQQLKRSSLQAGQHALAHSGNLFHRLYEK